MYRVIFTIFIVSIAFNTFSQSKKTVKKENVKSRTVKEYDYSSEIENAYITEIIKYDEKGNEIEIIEYNSNSKIKKHTESIYNEDDKEISRTYFYPNGKIKKVYKYFYEGKLRTEKYIYDEEGKLQLKQEYIYEKFPEGEQENN